MKKLLVLSLILAFAMPAFSQKLSKAEKAAKAKAEYELALKCIESRSFVVVPSQYMTADNLLNSNTDDSNFFSCEGEKFYVQGTICCDNNRTNVAEATEYDLKLDKKGNIKLRIVLLGRMLKGSYSFTIRNNGNFADVIFTPPTGRVRKFSGNLVPLNATSYNKRSNPI